MDLKNMTISEFRSNIELLGYEWAAIRDHLKRYFFDAHTPIKKSALVLVIMEKYKNKFELKTIALMIKDYCDAGVLIDSGTHVKLSTTEELAKRDEQILSNRKTQSQA